MEIDKTKVVFTREEMYELNKERQKLENEKWKKYYVGNGVLAFKDEYLSNGRNEKGKE